MKFFKKNLNKILLILIYIVMFYGVSNLLAIILKDYAINNNKQLLCSTIINVSVYLVLIVSCVVLLKKEIKTDFNTLNRTDAMSVFLICVIGIVCAYIGNYLGSFITMILGGSDQSQNQQGIEQLLTSKYGLIIGFTVIFIGPIVEELIFRKSIHDVLRSVKCPTWLILIVSSVLFGFIHVLDNGDLIQVFPYILMGLTLGGVEIFSKNIYPSIFVHIFINAVSTAMVLYMLMLEQSGLVAGI